MWHNETMNVWSHFLGNLTALGFFVFIVICYRNYGCGVPALPVMSDYVPAWPILVFLASAMFCLGCSAIYHLFNCHSPNIDNALSRLDYGGISVLIAGSVCPFIWYTYACE